MRTRLPASTTERADCGPSTQDVVSQDQPRLQDQRHTDDHTEAGKGHSHPGVQRHHHGIAACSEVLTGSHPTPKAPIASRIDPTRAHHHVVDEEGMPAAGVSPTHDDPRADTPPSPQRANRRPMASSAHPVTRCALPDVALTTGAPGNNVHMSMRRSCPPPASPIPACRPPICGAGGSMLGTERPTSWPPDCCRQTNARSFTPSTAWRGTPTRSWTGSTRIHPQQQRADALDRWSRCSWPTCSAGTVRTRWLPRWTQRCAGPSRSSTRGVLPPYANGSDRRAVPDPPTICTNTSTGRRR